uniref:pilus assembly protein TadG-related protein n=1 Tax=Nocardioides jensenii TaxID=1843 RepID=UPI000AD4CD2E
MGFFAARRRDERGAVVPMVAIMMTVLLGVTAFAVDIGHQRVERRDVQAVADMIALDASRQLDGRTQAVIKATSTWRAGIAQSVARNSNLAPLPTVTVQQQQEVARATVAGSPMVVEVVMGVLDESGAFTTTPYPEVPTAVKVTVKSSVDYVFAPGGGTVSRSAVAMSESQACFKIGSYAAGF